ncbi:MAG: phosphatase PAP2 family protein, partial [Nocardioidaceae bacterium]
LKSWNAFNELHDDPLLRLDKWLFFGHSPAVLLHDLLGQHVAEFVLPALYQSFTQMVPVSLVAALVLAHRIRDGYVFLMSAMWVWILGVGSYYLIPTLGPFASAPQDFSHLPHTEITSTQAKYMAERAHLLQHPAAGDAFASIAAFASLHIGFTFMVVLMLRYYGFRRATQAMSVYLAAVIIATIYLGWHYVVDDIAGLALAYFAVLFGRLMIYPPGRRSP